jgi:hypothetical protein
MHRFTLWMRSNVDDADERLYSRCDDATFGGDPSRPFCHFDREAPTLIEAVTSAIRDVQAAGLAIERIDIDREDAQDNPAAAEDIRRINMLVQALRPVAEVA